MPVRIDDGALLLADMLPVPFPRFRVDRFSDGTDCAERRKVVAVRVLVAETTEETDSSRGSVELYAGMVSGRALWSGSEESNQYSLG